LFILLKFKISSHDFLKELGVLPSFKSTVFIVELKIYKMTTVVFCGFGEVCIFEKLSQKMTLADRR